MLFRPKPPGERPRSEWPWLDLDGFTLGSPNGFTSSSDRIRIYLNPNIEGEDVYYFAHEVMKVEVVYRSASEVESESRPSKSKPQKVGRPPITPDEDMRLAEDWWAAHNCKSTKEEFCERRGIDVEFLNATLARVRTRRNRVKSP